MLFFLGTTLSYVAPEIFCGVGTKTNKCSDIYSLGISMFEILSNLDSPWENVVSFPSDCMIKDAVAKDLRPDLDNFDLIYDQETLGMKTLIQNSWQNDPLQRPNCKEVCISFFSFLSVISPFALPFSLFPILLFHFFKLTDVRFYFYLYNHEVQHNGVEIL